MRVVLDTNVLISAIFFSGTPSKILTHWRTGNFTAVISKPIWNQKEKAENRAHLNRRSFVALLTAGIPIPDGDYILCLKTGK